jgi:hypothetical protein
MVVSETIGKRKKIGVQWVFFFCMMLSPVVGYAVTFLLPDNLKAAK